MQNRRTEISPPTTFRTQDQQQDEKNGKKNEQMGNVTLR